MIDVDRAINAGLMSNEVLTRVSGQVGHITLNRPEALHALNLKMCEAILTALTVWKHDPSVQVVMIDHAEGSRGFCAGGDIVMLRDSGMGDASEARAFFAEEYRMNAAIKAFPKPYVAIMDGVTMGGGVGLSVHGRYRVATERTLFAMPETGIGLFPDVGGGWFLPRLEGELGTWLALTGARLKGSDVANAGVATHYMASDRLEALKASILAADFTGGADQVLAGLLNGAADQDLPDATYAPEQGAIDRCFAGEDAEAMVEALQAEGSEWSLKQAETLLQKSPETVKVALRQVREGAVCATFEDNMRMEYRIGWRKVQSPDFIEGVRAVVVDKDHAPKWSPATLSEVSDAQVGQYFAPLGSDELSFD
ncbi:MAG: enoyl-CoA hydratase/isomerase family protein [Henriciella sp.]|nr:enoyl-CoA hydratase/isomerase family protein [Henriciella sp.]